MSKIEPVTVSVEEFLVSGRREEILATLKLELREGLLTLDRENLDLILLLAGGFSRGEIEEAGWLTLSQIAYRLKFLRELFKDWALLVPRDPSLN